MHLLASLTYVDLIFLFICLIAPLGYVCEQLSEIKGSIVKTCDEVSSFETTLSFAGSDIESVTKRTNAILAEIKDSSASIETAARSVVFALDRLESFNRENKLELQKLLTEILETVASQQSPSNFAGAPVLPTQISGFKAE